MGGHHHSRSPNAKISNVYSLLTLAVLVITSPKGFYGWKYQIFRINARLFWSLILHDLLLMTLLFSHEEERLMSKETQPPTAGVPLTARILLTRNTNDTGLRRYWEVEEKKRVANLVRASRALGFELPRRCY